MQTTGSLTRSQLRQLEAELGAERARLERSMSVAAAAHGVAALASQEQGGVPGGEPDDDVDVALRGRVRARHEAVRAALRRIETGTYGRCAGCGEPIPFGRLLVMPESERCVACGALA
jgi:RNA polymerase-binding transcription factor DksA